MCSFIATCCLQFFNEVTPSLVLRVLLENSQIEQGMKKIEERDQLFGRLFGILAIFRSTRLTPVPKKDSINVVKQCTEEVLNLYMSKRWLREICIQTFLTMLRNVHEDLIPVILEGTLPLFQEQKIMENEGRVAYSYSSDLFISVLSAGSKDLSPPTRCISLR